jgi:hypothetical protein
MVATLVAGTLLALVLAPVGNAAAAGPASRQTRPVVTQEIEEQGSNGFFIKVDAHDRHQLVLSATRFDRDLAIEGASYSMPLRRQRDPRAITASLGKLGRVEMRFIPRHVKESPSPDKNCKGPKVIEEEGEWVGLLAFHGERGFTDVHVHRALGTVTKVPPQHCRPEKPINLKKLLRELEALEKEIEAEEGPEKGAEEEAEAEEEEPQTLELVALAHHRRVAFAATRVAFGSGHKRSSTSNLVVVGGRRRGRIKETSSVIDIFAPGSYFRPTDAREPGAELVAKPPFPFSGSATFREPRKGKPTWSGDLKVALPGFGEVRLAGPGTHAVTCEAPSDRKCESGLAGRASALLRTREAR